MRDRLAGFGFSLYGAGERDERIPMLIALLTSGTDKQKEEAAMTLGNLFAMNDENNNIAQEGGIISLIALARLVGDADAEGVRGGGAVEYLWEQRRKQDHDRRWWRHCAADRARHVGDGDGEGHTRRGRCGASL